MLFAALFGAAASHAQGLKDPELLARYDELASARPDAPDAAFGFEAFAADYLAAAQSKDAPCLFGCSSGFSGDGPDYRGVGYREFLARADLVLLARKLDLPADAIEHLGAAAVLLRPQWELHASAKSDAVPDDQKRDLLIDNGWMSYEGCIGNFTYPQQLAKLLEYNAEQLRTQKTLSVSQSAKLGEIELALSQMSAENER